MSRRLPPQFVGYELTSLKKLRLETSNPRIIRCFFVAIFAVSGGSILLIERHDLCFVSPGEECPMNGEAGAKVTWSRYKCMVAITFGTVLLGCFQKTAVPRDGSSSADAPQDSSFDAPLLRDAPVDTSVGDIACGSLHCAATELCLHVCDCCGIPTFDGGPQPSGHDECVPDTGQCKSGSGSFYADGRSCMCSGGAHEAQCLCT